MPTSAEELGQNIERLLIIELSCHTKICQTKRPTIGNATFTTVVFSFCMFALCCPNHVSEERVFLA